MTLLPRIAFPLPNRRDLVALPLVLALLFVLAHATRQMAVPFTLGEPLAISTRPVHLPAYAMYTVLRMAAALALSFVFTLAYATLAAKNRYAEQILVPLLDILQSVPILGYLSITVTGFLALFPHSLLGLQFAVIFAVFTSQVWNMTFALYQGLKTLPQELSEAATLYRLPAWQRFWKLELPFAMPGLLWNTMMSLSGGWFFVVAAEAVTVHGQQVAVPGIGSYIALAIENRDLSAIYWAIAVMLGVIFLYDWLIFRPFVAWADKFRMDNTGGAEAPQSWVRNFLQRTRLIRHLLKLPALLWELSVRFMPMAPATRKPPNPERQLWLDRVFAVLLALAALWALQRLYTLVPREFGWGEVAQVFYLGLVTGLKVFVLVALSALIWVPVGVLIGLHPTWARRVQPLAQFLAAFPANLLFPLVVVLIVRLHLNVDVWTSPLMILGSQWYLLFSVIGGATALPNDLREAARSLNLKGWLKWRRLYLPGVFSAFVTGAITASGGAWNASIVAEVVQWGPYHLTATGLGAYISQATAAGNMHAVALGVGVMALYVTAVNRLFWRRLYALAEDRIRLN